MCLFITNPVTAASRERTFSRHKLKKTSQRSKYLNLNDITENIYFGVLIGKFADRNVKLYRILYHDYYFIISAVLLFFFYMSDLKSSWRRRRNFAQGDDSNKTGTA